MARKSNIRIFTALALCLSMALCSCGDKGNGGGAQSSGESSQSASEDGGPVISLSKTEVSAGQMAEVTLSVKGAQQKWNMCGIHITFPEELEIDMLDEEERLVKFDKGSASEYATASLAMSWTDELPEELAEEKLHSVFFTEMFDGNSGLDGDICTIHLKVPEDAQSGTVYPLSYYYMESDIFSNAEQNTAFQDYAFSHMQDGSITVK